MRKGWHNGPWTGPKWHNAPYSSVDRNHSQFKLFTSPGVSDTRRSESQRERNIRFRWLVAQPVVGRCKGAPVFCYFHFEESTAGSDGSTAGYYM
eukprot:7530080-Pyramimonas_sp.AAC.2